MSKRIRSQKNTMVIDPMVKKDPLHGRREVAALFDGILKKNKIQETYKEGMLRYILYVYDPGSPFVLEHPDIRDRKKQVSATEQFNYQSVPFEAVTLILRHVIKSSDWTLIASYENTFAEFAEHVNTPLTKEGVSDDEKLLKAVERKAVLLNKMFDINLKLKSLKKEYFNEDIDLEEASKDVFEMTPEKVASKQAEDYV